MIAMELLQIKGYNNCPVVFEEDLVIDGLLLMRQLKMGALLVKNGRKEIVGIVSERDYARKVLLRARRSSSTLVGEIMTRQIVYVDPNERIEDCMKLMITNNIRHLPVLRNDVCFGFLSALEVASFLLDRHEDLIDQLNKYICGSQFAPDIVKKVNYKIAT